MAKRYIVRLTADEQSYLREIVSKGARSAQMIKHANILLQSDANGPGQTDEKIATLFHCHSNTVASIRQRFVHEGMEAALSRKKRETCHEKLVSGEVEARLIALACSKAPEGYARWSLRLLSDKLVELQILEAVSHETVRKTLKKTNSNRIYEPAGSSPKQRVANS